MRYGRASAFRPNIDAAVARFALGADPYAPRVTCLYLAFISLPAEAEARRPPAERAVIAHCSRCHTVESMMAASHTRMGWYFAVWHMRVWNGADLPPGAAGLIVENTCQRAACGRRQANHGVRRDAGMHAAGLAAWRLMRRERS